MQKIIQIMKKWMPEKLYYLCAICWYNIRIAKGYHQVQKNRIVRIKKNEKMRIVFIVQRTEVFNSVRSIFEAAVASDQCEVYLLPIPRRNLQQTESQWNTYPTIMEFCRKLGGGKVIDTYNFETQAFFDLEQISPDYIFLNVPYTDEYPVPYEIHNLVRIAKVCYVPYGYQLPNEKRFEVLYSGSLSEGLLQNVDFLFADSKATFVYSQQRMWLSTLLYGKRLYELGFPRFDNISIESGQTEVKNILWLPRWTSENQEEAYNLPSCFFEYKDLLPKYIEERKDGHLIIRPHPLAFQNYVEKGVMTVHEVQAYKQRIALSQWVSLDEQPSYEESFANADILVADYSSIIIEYAYLGKPIIYCGNPEDLSPLVSYLTETFYYVKNWEQMKKVLDDLSDGIDPMKERRDIAVEQFRNSTQNASAKIMNVLWKDFSFS